MRIELKTNKDAFDVQADNFNHINFSCEVSDGKISHALHYWLEPAHAKELAYSLLAAVSQLEQTKK